MHKSFELLIPTESLTCVNILRYQNSVEHLKRQNQLRLELQQYSVEDYFFYIRETIQKDKNTH